MEEEEKEPTEGEESEEQEPAEVQEEREIEPEEKLPQPERLEEEVETRKAEEEKEKKDIEKLEAAIRKEEVEPVEMPEEDRELIAGQVQRAETILDQIYHPEIPTPGIFTSPDPKSQYHGEIWARDSALIISGLLSNLRACLDTLKSLFRYQREDGALPIRIEYKRHLAQYVFGWLKKFGLDLVSRKEPRPAYDDLRFLNPARDTASSLIIATSEVFSVAGEKGKDFVEKNWEKMKAALKREEEKFADPEDGLIRGENCQDWAESIKRDGKLAYVNILYLEALRRMTFMARKLGKREEAEEFHERSEKVRESVMETFWDEEGGYFKAGDKDPRIDAPANIFACLYLVGPEKAVKIQEALKNRLSTPSGLLKNFDPPYPSSMIAFGNKIAGIAGFHNEYVWPWVTHQNILAKLKIAEEHPDREIKQRFQEEAVKDYQKVAQVHRENGDFFECLYPETGKSVKASFRRYRASPALAGSASTFLVVRQRLEKMGFQS